MQPPITPSVSGRVVEFDADVPVVEPTKSLLLSSNLSSTWCSSLGLSDGRVAWLQSQCDVDPGTPSTNTPGNGSGDSGHATLWFGYADDEETFLTEDDSVTSMRCLFHVDAAALAGRITLNGTLFRIPSEQVTDPETIYMLLVISRLDSGATIPHVDPDFEDPDTVVGGEFYAATIIYKSTDNGATWAGEGVVSSRIRDSDATVRPVVHGPSYPYFYDDQIIQASQWFNDQDTDWQSNFGPTPLSSQSVLSTNDVGTWPAAINWDATANDINVWSIVDIWAKRGTNGVGESRFTTGFSHNPTTGKVQWVDAPDDDDLDWRLHEIDEDGSGAYSTFVDIDYSVTTEEDFGVRDASVIMWDDGNGMQGIWHAGANPFGAVESGMWYVTAPNSWTPLNLVGEFQFTNWPTSGLDSDFLISPGINYYHVTARKYVLGIHVISCVPPPPLNIFQKDWAEDDEPSPAKAENVWDQIERWCDEVTASTDTKCKIQLGDKRDISPHSLLDKYTAIEQWADECLCCVTAEKHKLSIDLKDWGIRNLHPRHNQQCLLAIERWAEFLHKNCGV